MGEILHPTQHISRTLEYNKRDPEDRAMMRRLKKIEELSDEFGNVRESLVKEYERLIHSIRRISLCHPLLNST